MPNQRVKPTFPDADASVNAAYPYTLCDEERSRHAPSEKARTRMSGQPEHRDPDELSVPEKILRVQDLWDDIARSPRDVEITLAQREEAERRLLAHEKNPQDCSSWEEIKRRLEGGR